MSNNIAMVHFHYNSLYIITTKVKTTIKKKTNKAWPNEKCFVDYGKHKSDEKDNHSISELYYFQIINKPIEFCFNR